MDVKAGYYKDVSFPKLFFINLVQFQEGNYFVYCNKMIVKFIWGKRNSHIRNTFYKERVEMRILYLKPITKLKLKDSVADRYMESS